MVQRVSSSSPPGFTSMVGASSGEFSSLACPLKTYCKTLCTEALSASVYTSVSAQLAVHVPRASGEGLERGLVPKFPPVWPLEARVVCAWLSDICVRCVTEMANDVLDGPCRPHDLASLMSLASTRSYHLSCCEVSPF